eukprot:1597199-Pyramimonas_sp.AAC.1
MLSSQFGLPKGFLLGERLVPRVATLPVARRFPGFPAFPGCLLPSSARQCQALRPWNRKLSPDCGRAPQGCQELPSALVPPLGSSREAVEGWLLLLHDLPLA